MKKLFAILVTLAFLIVQVGPSYAATVSSKTQAGGIFPAVDQQLSVRTATSATSNAVGTGAKTFTTQAGLKLAASQPIKIVETASGANFMQGTVTSYSGTTLVINVPTGSSCNGAACTGGSGTHTDWTIYADFLTTPVDFRSGFVYNPNLSSLPNLRAAILAAKNNTAQSRVIWIGSSSVAGYYTGGTGIGSGWNNSKSLEGYLATNLTNLYNVPANADSIFGIGADNSDALDTFRSGDSRVSKGAGWIPSTVISIGGAMFENSTTTNNLSFTMPTTADKVTLWYATDNSGSPTLGVFTWQLNSGSTTSIDSGASAPGVASATITMTPGTNTLKIARVSGQIDIIGVEPYLSTVSTIHIINSGMGGARAASWTDSGAKAYSVNTAWAAISPAAIFLQLDGNDALDNTDDTAYTASMQSIITGAGGSSDVVLIAQNWCGGSCTVAHFALKTTDEQNLAVTNSIPFINQRLRFDSYAGQMTSLGLVHGDNLHSDPAGYLDQSNYLTDQIMTLAGVAPLQTMQPDNSVSSIANTAYTGINSHTGAETHTGVETHSGAETHAGAEAFAGAGKIESGSHITAGVISLSVSGGAIATDASLGNEFVVTPTHSTATTMSAPTNPTNGQRIIYKLAQDSTGSGTITWDTVFDFGGSGAPTLTTTASKHDLVGFVYDSTAIKWNYTGGQFNFAN